MAAAFAYDASKSASLALLRGCGASLHVSHYVLLCEHITGLLLKANRDVITELGAPGYELIT